PLLNDENIEDISCDGANIPVFVYHRNQKIASVKTTVMFEEREVLSDFVMKLAQRCGRAVSVAEPILEGALPDGSRVQAILETDIARRGSNITVRKFSKDPITPVHLLKYNTTSAKVLAYLWYLVEHRCSILICGPTASGKTSLLNALSLFINPSMKIVSIEDTPELRLPHSHWVPEISREGFGVGDSKIGEVSLFELLKGALRQRPDYIIVGEVRGQEAYILFQAMATGHAGLSTIHADSIEKVIDRLTTPPISLPASLVETLNLIVFIKRVRHGKAYVRRLFEVHEVLGYDLVTKKPKTRMVFKWDPIMDKFEIVADSEALGKICESEGVPEAEMKRDLFFRKKLLEWMIENRIEDYRDVGNIIAEYYSDEEKIINTIS
ncbi:MAG: type II/IV secretion system ATPase subunit, partial [Candidatus Aenigmarchaeota archaeon]|nr:type II/IV secretion system ATPase subunit [Candidatus Aenigmarchaeota archaeon]